MSSTPAPASATPYPSAPPARIRDLTIALPPYAAQLLNAQDQGATDNELQHITADALKEVYFQDRGRRAADLEEVRFTDFERLDFDL